MLLKKKDDVMEINIFNVQQVWINLTMCVCTVIDRYTQQ